MKQQTFFRKSRTQHGGSLLLGRRRSRRPLATKTPLHVVMRSDFAYEKRSLTKNKARILRILDRSARRFRIRVYEKAIVSNHIHLVIRGRRRIDIQNFFRVFAGHTAQEILEEFPIGAKDRPRSGGAPRVDNERNKTREKENKFWETRVFTRIVSWGRDYIYVIKYVIQNQMEADGLVPYRERKPKTKVQRRCDTS